MLKGDKSFDSTTFMVDSLKRFPSREYGRNIIFVGDPHADSIGISSRADDYPKTFLGKMRFVLELARERDAVVVLAGDVFHEVAQTVVFMNDFVRLLLEFADVVVVSVYGNHDLHYGSMDYVGKSPLTTLVQAGVVRIVWDTPFQMIVDDKRVNIYGQNYGEPVPVYDIDGDVNILVAHSFINRGWGDRDIITGEQLKGLGYHYVLAGHDHTPYQVLNQYDMTIIRPGSLMRTENSEFNRERDVRVVVLDVLSGVYEYVKVPIIPGGDVFRFHMIHKAENVQGIGNFDAVMSMLSSKVENEVTISTLVAGMDFSQSPGLKDRVHKRLSDAGVSVVKE